jgi:ATP-dependent DNA helicase RecG
MDTPLRDLRGIGREREELLAKLKVNTLGDLLLNRPRRYEDRGHYQKIASVKQGESVAVHGRVVVQGLKRFKRRRGSMYEFVIDDGSGHLTCRWWNAPYLDGRYRVGDEVCVYGRVTGLKPPSIDHPETEVVVDGEENSVHLHRIVPVYRLTEGLPQRWLRALMWRLLEQYGERVPDPHPDLGDGWPERSNAVRTLHFPEEMEDTEIARRRLAMDELIDLQAEFQRRRKTMLVRAQGLACGGDNRLMRPFLAAVGFELTGAQTRVLREIRDEMSGGAPMRRLLQGDVGSGKTVVAACAALMAVESGYNVAVMAPTEILAEQHHQTFRRWFEPLGMAVNLLTGSRKVRADEPDLLSTRVEAGVVTVGTHALFQDSVAMERLGLVVIDEQHKFGVAQREALVRKGNYPHLLVMTATPIPRTLGLTLYGDLDVSVIDELPGGRGRIRTFVREPDKLARVWEFIGEQVRSGRQAYVVYPRLEDSDLSKGLKAVLDEYERLQREHRDLRFGLLHGRMKGDEKSKVMAALQSGEVQVLVATTVVEVGVNVPNATVMLIENAEQFGLAQLHQLRGRIGRGAHESYCILMVNKKDESVWDRLNVMTETTDGFRIAEEDLKLRGPGDMLGRDQSGFADFKFADLRRDLALVEQARELVKRIG